MQKLLIPITTASDSQKVLEITAKSSFIKKRLVKTWTNEQDQKLIAIYQLYPKRWNLISQKMKNRNQNQCLHRFRRITRLGQNKKIWTPHQDQVVLKMINQVGHNWKAIAQTLGTKSGKQIRERFINKLDPNIKREEWTQKEDMKIIELYSKLGSKWCEISKCLPGRPENKIKNRFYSYIQKNYDFKVKETKGGQEPLSNKENTPRKTGVNLILQKQSTNSSLSGKKNSTKLFGQKNNNGRQEQGLEWILKESGKNEMICVENMEQQKFMNEKSLKQINQECFFQYLPNQNNSDMLYFEDN